MSNESARSEAAEMTPQFLELLQAPPAHGRAPIACMVDGTQHVLVPAGTTLTPWTLPD